MNSYKEDSQGYWIEKDPDSILDYPMDWADWLQDGETITNSEWLVTDGITVDNSYNTAEATVVWLSTCIAGQTYMITNRITTSAGRQEDRSFRVKVSNR